MDLDTARDFIRAHHHAVLATMRRDGTPQLSPVAAAVDADGRVVVSTREHAAKTRNVRRDPRAWLCMLTDDFWPAAGRSHVQVEGDVDVLSLPEAMEPLVEYYRAVSGEHPDWDDYRAAMEREQRVLLRMTLTRAGPDSAG